MPPKIDKEVGCIIPDAGDWPVPPQEDVEPLETRIWVDGCFDFFHHGHAGVMLQSRRLGEELVVGLHSDEDIAQHKGPTVMNLAERVAAVEACRFSSFAVPHAPYVTSLAWISHYGCQYVSHGDDITSDEDGNDCYRFVKKAGRMKIVPRTPGISTTDLVGRMLLCTKDHFIKNLVSMIEGDEGSGTGEERKANGKMMETRIREYATAPNGMDSYVQIWSWKAKHRTLERRSSHINSKGEPRQDTGKGTFTPMVEGQRPKPGQRVVYVDGGFDLFSSGHISFLRTVSETETALAEQRGWYSEEAKQRRINDTGSDYPPAYVVAGIHDDEVINYYKGVNYPIMNIFERGLCVVQCKYIHSVVFGAPYTPTQLYLSALPTGTPDAVYHGPTTFMPTSNDPYKEAKEMGIFEQVAEHAFQEVNAAHIVKRILNKRAQYEERQRKKGQKGVGEAAVKKREAMEKEAKAAEDERLRIQREVERQFAI
ncbi:hypothetical protein MBLNU230_g1600t1 [Neophaeotheca triangularis]